MLKLKFPRLVIVALAVVWLMTAGAFAAEPVPCPKSECPQECQRRAKAAFAFARLKAKTTAAKSPAVAPAPRPKPAPKCGVLCPCGDGCTCTAGECPSKCPTASIAGGIAAGIPRAEPAPAVPSAPTRQYWQGVGWVENRNGTWWVIQSAPTPFVASGPTCPPGG